MLFYNVRTYVWEFIVEWFDIGKRVIVNVRMFGECWFDKNSTGTVVHYSIKFGTIILIYSYILGGN